MLNLEVMSYITEELIENSLEEMDEDSVLLPKSRKEAIKYAESSDFIKDILPASIIDKYL